MRVLLSGSSGFIGRALRSFLESRGDEVVGLERGDLSSIRGKRFDAVVHLAGEPIFGRWTADKKRRIVESRVQFTKELCQSVQTSTFISASAVGYYGDRGEELLTEEASAGAGFLADVCTAWEQASEPVESRGVRRVIMRFGIVVGAGGALAKMLPAYKLGLGGPLGSGAQWVSWVALSDLVRAIAFALDTPHLAGAVNVVAPNGLRQREWAQELARALRRPAILWAPGWLLRILLGEMAEGLLLASQHAVPVKLRAAGFIFEFPFFRQALQLAFK